MTEEKANLPFEAHEVTDSDCPWCENPLYQGEEMRYCGSCPFSAMYPEKLSDAPYYIIQAFGEYMEERYEEEQHD